MKKIGVSVCVKGMGTTLVLNESEILRACKETYVGDLYVMKDSHLNLSKKGRVSVTLRMLPLPGLD